MTENETGYYSKWERSLNESNTSEAVTSPALYLAWWTLSSSSNVTATALVVNGSTPELSLDEDGNATEGQNCTNDYCIPDIDYWNMVYQHVYPKDYEWILIAMHSLVFVAGLVGNALVCLAVYRNHAMRTVTNYFIVNLAVADFMVILFCLPPTVLWDVTETWFMGTGLCKVVLYLQTVSVAVSVLTLTFISVDRWYAICFPLRFNSTTGRAKTAIAIIWLLALAFDIPELVVLRARGRDWDSVLLTQCEGSWSYDSEMVFHGAKSLLLYTLPLLFMSVAYFQIVRVLWRSDNIPGHDDHNGDVITSKEAGHHATFAPSGSVGSRRIPMAGNSTTEAQLRSRRKAAKMLVAVVAMFAICYLPVHLLNILRYTVDIPQNDTTSAISMLSHWLCYANSAVNPVIYNFMSGKFRAEFRRLFWTCAYGSNRYSPAPGAAPSAAMVGRHGGARQRLVGGGGAAPASASAGHEMRSLYRRGP